MCRYNKVAYAFAIYFLVLILFSSAFVTGCGEISQQTVLVHVNDDKIEKKDVEEFIKLIYLYMPDTQEIYSQGEYIDELQEEVLWFLIENTLISQEVKKLGFTGDEEKIKEHYQLSREELVSGIYGSEEKFLERLKELELNEDFLKSVSRNAYFTELLYEHVSADVTEEDARAFVEENPLFLKKPAQAYVFQIIMETEEDVQYVHNLLSEGADFVEVGQQYSIDPYVELGIIKANDLLDPLFLETAFSLAPGEISDPVEIAGGYHIIKITEKKEEADLSFEEVKEEAMEIKKSELFEKYFLELMEDARIETFKLDE